MLTNEPYCKVLPLHVRLSISYSLCIGFLPLYFYRLLPLISQSLPLAHTNLASFSTQL